MSGSKRARIDRDVDSSGDEAGGVTATIHPDPQPGNARHIFFTRQISELSEQNHAMRNAIYIYEQELGHVPPTEREQEFLDKIAELKAQIKLLKAENRSLKRSVDESAFKRARD